MIVFSLRVCSQAWIPAGCRSIAVHLSSGRLHGEVLFGLGCEGGLVSWGGMGTCIVGRKGKYFRKYMGRIQST